MGTVSAQSAPASGHITWQLEPAAYPEIRFPEEYAWTPEQPNLFDVTFCVYDGQAQTDEVQSYFGLRKISVQDGRVYLNNRLYYQRLLLDQGYWPQSLLTTPAGAHCRPGVAHKVHGCHAARKRQ